MPFVLLNFCPLFKNLVNFPTNALNFHLDLFTVLSQISFAIQSFLNIWPTHLNLLLFYCHSFFYSIHLHLVPHSFRMSLSFLNLFHSCVPLQSSYISMFLLTHPLSFPVCRNIFSYLVIFASFYKYTFYSFTLITLILDGDSVPSPLQLLPKKF